MNKFIKFGLLSPKTVVKGIFLTSFLQIFLFFFYKYRGFTVTITSTWSQILAYKIYVVYHLYLQPIVIIIWLKFVCDFLYRVMVRDDGE